MAPAPPGTISASAGIFQYTPPLGPTTSAFEINVTDNAPSPLIDFKTFSVAVDDVAPTVQLPSAGEVEPGTLYIASGSFVDPGQDTWEGDRRLRRQVADPET